MGSLCSKLCSKFSTHEGGHTILNSNTLGGGAEGSSPPENASARRREMELAAERRLKERENRGVVGDGRGLAKDLKNKKTQLPEHPEGPNLVWD